MKRLEKVPNTIFGFYVCVYVLMCNPAMKKVPACHTLFLGDRGETEFKPQAQNRPGLGISLVLPWFLHPLVFLNIKEPV